MDKNENVRRIRAIGLLSLKDYIEALKSQYGLGTADLPTNNMEEMDFNQMIQNQMKQDSVLK